MKLGKKKNSVKEKHEKKTRVREIATDPPGGSCGDTLTHALTHTNTH